MPQCQVHDSERHLRKRMPYGDLPSWHRRLTSCLASLSFRRYRPSMPALRLQLRGLLYWSLGSARTK